MFIVLRITTKKSKYVENNYQIIIHNILIYKKHN